MKLGQGGYPARGAGQGGRRLPYVDFEDHTKVRSTPHCAVLLLLPLLRYFYMLHRHMMHRKPFNSIRQAASLFQSCPSNQAMLKRHKWPAGRLAGHFVASCPATPFDFKRPFRASSDEKTQSMDGQRSFCGADDHVRFLKLIRRRKPAINSLKFNEMLACRNLVRNPG